MTETEWAHDYDATRLLRFIIEGANARKLRLFAAAYARSIVGAAFEERSTWANNLDAYPRVVSLLERFVDGEATEDQLKQIGEELWNQGMGMDGPELGMLWITLQQETTRIGGTAETLLLEGTQYFPWTLKDGAIKLYDKWFYERHGPWHDACADVIREVYGNPFRPIDVAPGWLSTDVVEVARRIYINRTFESMPKLADALETAGCRELDLLAHCRSDAPHAFGCWAIDLLLDRS